MKALTTRSITRPGKAALAVLFSLAVSLASAQDPSASISLGDALAGALSSDYRVVSAAIDTESARAQESAAKLRRLPALGVSGSYTRLSHVDSSIALGPMGTMDLGSQDDAFSFSANLQYPVFAGFRLAESVRLAALQRDAKEIAEAMAANAVAFETARAYWDALRAKLNVNTLRENHDLTQRNYEVTSKKVAQGTALNADLLAAGMRRDQALMDLAGGLALRDRAFFYLSSLVHAESAASYGVAVDPVSDPAVSILPDDIERLLGEGSDRPLVACAFANRSEAKLASLSGRLAGSAKKISEAPLYPTLAVTGNYTFANPNQRYTFSGNEFNGTWSLGAALSYDLGGLPANLKNAESKGIDAKKTASDGDQTAETIILDVRSCALALERARGDLELVSSMLAQAAENERVTAQRVKSGTANDLDLLAASFARVRSEFSIVNKEIDCRIAEADLARAVGLPVAAGN